MKEVVLVLCGGEVMMGMEVEEVVLVVRVVEVTVVIVVAVAEEVVLVVWVVEGLQSGSAHSSQQLSWCCR